MKRIKLLLPILALLFIACSGNTQNKMAVNHQMKEGDMKKNEMMKDKMVKSQTIKLKKGELFIVISSITKPDVQDLMNAYFGKIFPIAQKNGFKPLSNLPIDKVVAGNYQPNNFVGLYSWPGMSSVEAFSKELPNSELTPMRMKIWDELKQNISAVTEDFEFTLQEGKVYELQFLWGTDNMPGMMNQSLVKKYNGKIIFDVPVVAYEDLNHGTSPNQMVLVEWSSEKEAEKYRKKKKSATKEETFYTHLQIPTN